MSPEVGLEENQAPRRLIEEPAQKAPKLHRVVLKAKIRSLDARPIWRGLRGGE
jgi:hypothetical protein